LTGAAQLLTVRDHQNERPLDPMPYLTPERRLPYLSIAQKDLQDAPAIIFSNSLGCDHLMWQPQARCTQGAVSHHPV
jgi:hypothetical protein